MFKHGKLRTFNNFFTVAVMGLSFYIILTPFVPYFSLWASQATDGTNGYRYQSQLADDSGEVDGNSDLAPIPELNTLVIPQIQVDATVNEGADISALAVDGVWRRPQTSTPDQGGNTVLVAHRFSYGDPATFYHLDRIQNGDRLAVFWNEQEYIYEVNDIFVVDPSQIEVEAPSDDPTLTLYTCTPVWTATQRLIVKANLVSDPTGNLLADNVNEYDFDQAHAESVDLSLKSALNGGL